MNNASPKPQSHLSFAFAGLVFAMTFAPQNLLATETSAATPSTGPQATLVEFYGWYLQSVNQHHDPLSDNRAKMEQYASKKLLQKIDKLSSSPEGMDEDYFMKSQDILKDWETHIAVSQVRVKGRVATALVTLGATKESKHLLRLELVREGTSWKISKVR